MDIFLNRSGGNSQDFIKMDSVCEKSSESDSDKSSGSKSESSEDSLKSDKSLEEELKGANYDDDFLI